jgi:S-DNA-T family DNA segregation ATPase FtsK/SpoIIIE
MRTTPDEVRLILVDPKRVELGQYNNVPHLLTEVVTNPKKAANALDWAVREMEMRYDLLADIGVRDITGYNAMYDKGDIPTEDDPDPDTGKAYERLPFIVVVVDELADLMMIAARDVETSICRLAQMARAVGIHLVIATQRPSVDVITGVIKANIPSRIAFSVSTLADSRVILDQQGAEKLVGKGDMLLLNASSSRADRIQGAWVDEECVRKVVAHWKRQVVAPQYIEGVQGTDAPGGRSRGDADETDDLLAEAMELVVTSGLGSTSMLQRKLRVGFARAGRLMDLLERRGIVGPSEGSKARSVLMSVEELQEMQNKE